MNGSWTFQEDLGTSDDFNATIEIQRQENIELKFVVSPVSTCTRIRTPYGENP